MLRRLILMAVALAALGLQTASAQPGPRPARIAFLIGNWDYDLDARFTSPKKAGYASDLHNPCNDIALVKAKLAAARYEIFDYCNVDQADFGRKLQAFSDKLKDLPKGSVVFIYYSGHGIQTAGRNFLIPVNFRWNPETVGRLAMLKQLEFFRRNANEVAAMFSKLPDNPDVAIVVALDNCRENPIQRDDAYNEAVSIRTPPNAVMLYATTAGDTAPDGVDGASDFARELVLQLGKGGDVGDIVSRVNIALWNRFRADQRATYAEADVGPAFAAMRYVPLSVEQTVVTPTGRAELPRRVFPIRKTEDGMRLDILWCEGPGEADRFAYARTLAEKVAARAREFKVGRIQLKPLSQQINDNSNYGVYRNLMRYDTSQPRERVVLNNIAQAFPEANFLSRRGVGVGGKPTYNYVSAFVCGRTPE